MALMKKVDGMSMCMDGVTHDIKGFSFVVDPSDGIKALGEHEGHKWVDPDSLSFETTMTRGCDGGDFEFYDWALMAHREPVVETKRNIRIIHGRKWLWPKIYDVGGAGGIESASCEQGAVHATVKFESLKQWPWYRAAWWWVKRGFKVKPGIGTMEDSDAL